MAIESGFGLDLDYSSHSDNHAKQFYAVKLLSTADCDVVSDDADPHIGVLQNKPLAGAVASVRIFGVTKFVVDGSGTAIAYGDPITMVDAGTGIKATVNDSPMIGYAMGASSAAGDIISVLLAAPGAIYQAPAT